VDAAHEQKLLSLTGLGLALAGLTVTIVEQVQLQRSLKEAEALGAIVDVSPDQLQMNVRVSLALLLGSVSLWSGRANKIAIVVAVVFLGMSALTYADENPFDRAEPLIFVTAIGCLAIAIVYIRRQYGDLLTAGLASAFVLVNYVLWFFRTQRIKELAAVEELYPHTRLNNFLYGAHPWHIVFLMLTTGLIVWEVRVLKRRMTKRVAAAQSN